MFFPIKYPQEGGIPMSEMSIFNALYQGPSNRFACGALTAIAHMPGEIYNPL